MTALHTLLDTYRTNAQSEREKGTYFEELMLRYFAFEPQYRDLYAEVRTYADWATAQGLPATDTGIDLVATTRGTGECHAIQCKLYATDYVLQKKDIDSFFTASGKTHFSHRIIVSTCEHWSKHAEDALTDQQPPVTKIDLYALENSQIAWEQYQPNQDVVLKPKKSLRDHQKTALESVEKGLSTAHRGKLIMACGTGKTFTSLKIAEKLAGKGKRVLFLVPSLSLLSQTLTEWTQESDTPLHSFAVCSDSDVGKKKKTSDDDAPQLKAHELQYPATTNAKRLAEEMSKRHDAEHMSVVFSTYHSINVISDAQLSYQMAEFDLIICDEAHRTTGATFADEDESNFVRVHDDEFVLGKKRLYMTATPRIYGDAAKENAKNDQVAICSMDDEKLFGQELYTISFSEAVKRELLCDYKVIVLSVDEAHVNRRMQKLLSDDNNQLKVDDAAKIIGCWKALSKQDTQEDLIGDTHPMRRAVAFCQVIDPSPKAKTHKVSSKNIAAMFQAVVEEYQATERLEHPEQADTAIALTCEAEHVDGGMNASQKEAKLQWLKADTPEQTCRILSNVRCLSEGVDVPALDAVLFLTPRNSQVDVVQSVGRVMRKAEGKTRGYVILPVVIPAGVEPHDALNDNKTYKVVWQVLQALRSHDDRFDAMVNKMDLELNKSMLSKMEVIAITDKINKRSKASNTPEQQRKKRVAKARGSQSIGTNTSTPQPEQIGLEFEIGEIERAIYAKVVQKCGNRRHWEDWAADIAKIARTHIDRIQAILADPTHTREIAAFEKFAAELRDDLNNSISDSEIVEMLAQHLITKPVFDALFDEYSFASKNPMSLAMQEILDTLHEHRLDKEADTLNTFYDSVKERAKGIESAEGKQKIIVELYDKFFRNAFPKMTEKLGIVYTPVEVVDFILHSVNDVLKQEFGQTIGSKGVHVIDPFTGTGTFISRLIQSDLIADDEIIHKYKHELHANEIVLLAYYIAAINIEAAYHGRVIDEYTPFEGICLTDTFQMYEKEDLVSDVLVDNSARRTKQKNLDIRVIVGNPPYSIGQESANDHNANVSYTHLDQRIYETYAKKSNAVLSRGLYDSYIRAIRWASDRLGDQGVIGFVTNAGWVESNSADGLRKALAEEFSSLYVFHLRGNQRTSGERSRKEGGKIFGSGSRAPIAISLLVKNPNATENGKIHFYDIGDYLSREEKLEKISEFSSIQAVTDARAWQMITPDQHGDWLSQRDDDFSAYQKIGDRAKKSGIFSEFSIGVSTNRDAWVFNNKKSKIINNLISFSELYNSQLQGFSEYYSDKSVKEKESFIDGYICKDSSKISWTVNLKKQFLRGEKIYINSDSIRVSLYRPFSKNWLYFDRRLIERILKAPVFFPIKDTENLVISIKGNWQGDGHLALITDTIPVSQPDGGAQCFPLYLYEPTEQATPADDLFSPQNTPQVPADMLAQWHKEFEDMFPYDDEDDDFNIEILSVEYIDPIKQAAFLQYQNRIKAQQSATAPQYTRRDAITDDGLAHFADYYAAQTNGETISKEDLFYYIYGLLHSEDYRARYADNLSKELPRIPRVKTYAHFKHFSDAGRKLAHYHLNYETVEPYPVQFNCNLDSLTAEDFYVNKMKFGAGKDKSTVIYNPKITMSGIPLNAYDYVVNGKPALEWVIERQCVKTDKDSGIVNDANDWAIETMHNPRYPLELFQRVITVSLETMKIVNGLPKLEID